MNKIMRLLLIWLFVAGLSVSSVLVNASTVVVESVRSIQELNKIRNMQALPLFQPNKELEEAAVKHNRYMNYANVLSSIEEAGKPYFRGRYPWDRAAYAGYKNSYVNEMIGKGFNNYNQGWKTFLGDPYLRYNLLNPNYTDIGMDRYSEYSTYLLGGEPSSEEYEVIYPYHQQVNIPVSNSYYFSKNPYHIALKKENEGFPLSYTYYSNRKIEKFAVEQISLIRLNTNERLPITYLTNQLQNGIIILPLAPFEYFSSYRLNIRMKLHFADGKIENVNKVTQFTTENINKKLENSNIAYLTRMEFVKKMLQTFRYDLKTGLGIIFKDINPSSGDYKYVYTAYQEKLVMGTPNGEFLPNANIKEQDAYVIFIRAYEKKKGAIKLSPNDTLPFRQDIKADYVIDPLRKALKIGLIDNNRLSFDPNHFLTVQEFEEILKRYETISK